MSTLLKWAQTTRSSSKNNANGGREWIHQPDALQKGHVVYLVKFLGNTIVDQPKGIDVVKDGIRRLRFSHQLRKSETGAKTKKVELTISIDGVAIQEPRTHVILHQFPLHRISYCADDKGEKKFFSFIAKQWSPDNDQEEKHECFVFISDKLAEEITLTIGQAFELAYKRFLETSGRDLEAQKQAILMQQRIKRLEQENNIYKQRLLELAQMPSIKYELDQYLRKNAIKNILEIQSLANSNNNNHNNNSNSSVNNGTSGEKKGEDTSHVLLDLHTNMDKTNGNMAPPVPPRHFEQAPSVGTKLEGLLLDELETDQEFDPRSFETNQSPNFPFADTNGLAKPPMLAPPPKATKRQNGMPTSNNMNKFDPFGMGDFATLNSSQDLENAIGLLDKKMLEMQNGFSRGISFGNDDFSIESLDPLKN